VSCAKTAELIEMQF